MPCSSPVTLTLPSLIQGYNGTIFAFGQTGSGKSYTMFGVRKEEDEEDEEAADADIDIGLNRGLIPRAVSDIFRMIAEAQTQTDDDFAVKCSFLEIYNETVQDLLNPSTKLKEGLRVRETPTRGVWVEGLTEHEATDKEDVERLLGLGELNRTTAFTEMNAESSRSHSIFSVHVTSKAKDGTSKTGILSLVDLAGSEKVKKSKTTGLQMEEASNINKSLTSLGRCIFSLTQRGTQHVPYRDSKLTFILRDSLGGNSKTTLIVACSPSILDAEETLSTLRFAQRAKEIQNVVHVNKAVSVAALHATIKRLEKEIMMLKQTQKEEGLSPRLSPRVDGLQECRHCEGCSAIEREGFDCDTAAKELDQLEADLRISRDRLEETMRAMEVLDEAFIESQHHVETLTAELKQVRREADFRESLEEPRESLGCPRCEAMMEETATRIMELQEENESLNTRFGELEAEVTRLRGRVFKQFLLTTEEASGRNGGKVMKRLVNLERTGHLTLVTPTQGNIQTWGMLKAGFLYIFRNEASNSPSLLIYLGGAVVTPMEDPPHSVRIETTSGRRFLLQAEDDSDKKQWTSTILASRWHSVDFDSPDAMLDSPSWVPDMDVDRCTCCDLLFTITRRRHHCRACGRVACGSCSSQNRMLPSIGYETPQRVCHDCNDQIPFAPSFSSPTNDKLALVSKDYEGSPSCVLFSPPRR